MAAGDLILANYQYEYSGLLMGAGTPYLMEELQGLYDLPEVKSNDSERQDTHGVYPGIDLMSGKKLIARIQVLAASAEALETNMANLNRVFRPTNNELPLVWQRPNQGGKRFVNCRCRRRNFQADYVFAKGRAPGTAELFASDPTIYALVGKTATGSIPDGSSVSGIITANNGGDFETLPIIEIDGPFVAPLLITNQTDASRTVRLNATIPSGTTIRIDFKKRNVQTNTGGAGWIDHYEYVRGDNQWWVLQAGANTISVQRTGTTGLANIRVYWNDAWI